MHDLIRQLVSYIRGVLRYRWWLLSTAWVICIVGWMVVANMPDKFQASARVFVDTHSILKPLLRGLAVQTNEQNRIKLLTKTLLSRPNLEKVARMADLDLRADTPEEMEQQIDHLSKHISFRGTGGRQTENLYSLGYTDEDPALAKLVVQSLLTIFVESNLGEARKDQETVHDFLETQIKEHEARLVGAETNLTAFKQENMGFMSGSAAEHYRRLNNVKDSLRSAKLELKIQRDRMKILNQQLEGEVPTFGLVPTINSKTPEVIAASSETIERIQNLQLKADELLLRYTEQHPEVIAVRHTIKALKGKQAKEEKAAIEAAEEEAALQAQSAAPPPELERNVVYQQMKLAFSTAEAEAAAKKAIVEEYTQRVHDLESAVGRVLEVEAEKKQLNRDYETIKKNHTQLLSRLEAARMAKKVDANTSSVKFRVIDPPRVPHDPSGPNRIVLSSGVFIGGLGIGIGLAFLLSLLRPTFDDRRIMSDIIGLPVLASVDMVWTEVQKKKLAIRSTIFLMIFLALAATFILVLSAYIFNLDIGTVKEGIRVLFNKVQSLTSINASSATINTTV